MSSSAGPSRVSRPGKSSASTSKGSAASSTGTAEGARIGLLTEIFVWGDCEVMALYLGSERTERKGQKRRQFSPRVGRRPLAGRVKAPGQNSFLCMQAIFGLVEHHRLRTVDHLVGDFLAAMGRQAVHEERITLGQRHQLGVDLIGSQEIVA